jgi:quercetin dioxygenase-like cupin family protein
MYGRRDPPRAWRAQGLATVRAQGAGERRWFCGGGIHTWLATESETDGAFLLFEDALDAGKVTPLHLHPEADETFYMLEGEVRLHTAGDERLSQRVVSRSFHVAWPMRSW